MPVLWVRKGALSNSLPWKMTLNSWSTKICNHCHHSFLGRNDSNALAHGRRLTWRCLWSEQFHAAWWLKESQILTCLDWSEPCKIRKKTSWATGFSSKTVIRRSKHIKSVIRLRSEKRTECATGFSSQTNIRLPRCYSISSRSSVSKYTILYIPRKTSKRKFVCTTLAILKQPTPKKSIKQGPKNVFKNTSLSWKIENA